VENLATPGERRPSRRLAPLCGDDKRWHQESWCHHLRHLIADHIGVSGQNLTLGTLRSISLADPPWRQAERCGNRRVRPKAAVGRPWRLPPDSAGCGRRVLGEAANCGQDIVSRENGGGVEVDVVTALDVRLMCSRQNVDRRDRSRPREKREPERLAHSSAPLCILLNRHQ